MLEKVLNPAVIYLFKVNNGNTRTVCEICSKLTVKTLAGRRLLLTLNICDALRDLVSLLQFKKRRKHLWKSVKKIWQLY